MKFLVYSCLRICFPCNHNLIVMSYNLTVFIFLDIMHSWTCIPILPFIRLFIFFSWLWWISICIFMTFLRWCGIHVGQFTSAISRTLSEHVSNQGQGCNKKFRIILLPLTLDWLISTFDWLISKAPQCSKKCHSLSSLRNLAKSCQQLAPLGFPWM